MFSPRQALLSAALGVAITAPIQASAPFDEGTSTNSNTFNTALAAPAPWSIEISNAAKLANANHPLMSLTIWPLQQICKILAENGHADAIANLGQVSIHMAGRILKPVRDYSELFQDEDIRVNNPIIRQAIRVDLQNSIKARDARIFQGTRNEEAEELSMLAIWPELLRNDAPLRNLCWANDMFTPENLERVSQNGLLDQLIVTEDKAKALALAAAAAQIFMDKMDEDDQACIIDTALTSSCPPSEYAARGYACTAHLFTEAMAGDAQTRIMITVLNSSRPLSEYAALGAACKQHLFKEKMGGLLQSLIIEGALNASCPVSEYKARGDACKKYLFTEKMEDSDQAWIICAALQSSRAVSEYTALRAACRTHFFTEKTAGHLQARIICAALSSSRPLSEYKARGETCRAHLFTEGMEAWDKADIIAYVLPLSDTQVHQLVRECAERAGDDRESRRNFIFIRAKQLREGK